MWHLGCWKLKVVPENLGKKYYNTVLETKMHCLFLVLPHPVFNCIN